MTPLATVVGSTLARCGIRHAFGVAGGGNILSVAAMTAAGVHYVAARHEGGALSMADTYNRVSGEVAVCTTSHGTAMTNTLSGLAEAAKHGSGLVLVCGDAPTTGPRRNDVDQAALATTLGAEVVRVTDPAAVRADTARAVAIARTLRRPVLLCLPNDLLGADVPDGPVAVADVVVPEAPRAELAAVLDLLATARRPLLLGGLGAWRAGAGKSIVDLGDRIGALFATSALACGLFDGNPWSVGICGGFSRPGTAAVTSQADVVIAFGATLDRFTLHDGRMISPTATVVQVDLGGAATADRVDLVVAGDAAVVAAALLDGVNDRELTASSWRSTVEAELAALDSADRGYTDLSTADKIDPRALTLALAELIPEERTVVLDGGHFMAWPLAMWSYADPTALVFLGAASQSIGMGFAGSVGAVHGRTDRTTVVVLGDGGALMGLSELDTLIRTADSALVVVYDDAGYGFEAHLYGPQGADPSTVTFAETDFAGVAAALGARAVTVRSPADLAAVRAWRADGAPGTLVLDCKVVTDVLSMLLTDLRAGH
ncbi:thiamine pyrophosphate-binding protein [Actinophytocola sediminis]